MPETIFKLRNISKKGSAQHRLNCVDLDIAGGITAIIGPSGAGKTSILNLLTGFEKPDNGSILKNLDKGEHALEIYWVPQNCGLWPHLKVREHLSAVSRQSDSYFFDLMNDLGIAHRADAYPDELSQGESTRLAIARAIAADASVLVMDEPLSNVDEAGKGKYWGNVLDYVRKNGLSLIYSTHEPRHIMGEADQVVCLKEGAVTYAGTVDELYWNPGSRELAESLGDTNWFEPGETAGWLENKEDKAVSYRPEQLMIYGDEQGAYTVKSSKFLGELSKVELEDSTSGKTRTFLHRPPGRLLNAGQKVSIKILMLLLTLAFFISGCGKKQESKLEFNQVIIWNMPACGRSIPAPRSMAVTRKNEVIAIDTAGRVMVFNKAGKVLREWKMPDCTIGRPEGVCELDDGRIAVSDTHYNQVVIFTPDGKIDKIFGKKGTAPGEFTNPVGVAQDEHSNIYVCEYGDYDRVQKFTKDGEYILGFGKPGTGPGEFQRPSGLAFHDGKVYVADAVNNRIQIFTQDGKFVGVLGEKLKEKPSFYLPYDVKMGRDGYLYTIGYGSGKVTKLTLDGTVIGKFGKPGIGKGEFRTAWGLAIGPELRIYIADTGNRRIVVLE